MTAWPLCDVPRREGVASYRRIHSIGNWIRPPRSMSSDARARPTAREESHEKVAETELPSRQSPPATGRTCHVTTPLAPGGNCETVHRMRSGSWRPAGGGPGVQGPGSAGAQEDVTEPGPATHVDMLPPSYARPLNVRLVSTRLNTVANAPALLNESRQFWSWPASA